MDNEDRQKLERAREAIRREQLRDAEVQAAYEDDKRIKALESRFAKASRADVLYMFEHACNERGEMLSEFEFQALCEAWVRVFEEFPPSQDVVYDAENPPSPLACAAKSPNKSLYEESEVVADDDTMLSTKQVLNVTGMSLSTLKRKRTAGEVPRPYQISKRRIGWKAVDIKQYIEGMRRARGTRH